MAAREQLDRLREMGLGPLLDLVESERAAVSYNGIFSPKRIAARLGIAQSQAQQMLNTIRTMSWSGV